MSEDAFHARDTEVAVAPVSLSEVGAVGGDVSLHVLVEAVTDVFEERLPAASYASIASEYVLPHVRPVKVKLLPIPLETSEPSR